MELALECREIVHTIQCQSMSVTDRNEDPGDRKQVVWEDVMEKVTFKPSSYEGEGRGLSTFELLGD